ncbi:MAG: type I-C CRISPR-associated protein Cas8c/Csd1, partial [Gammaproteobacteria bacterium]
YVLAHPKSDSPKDLDMARKQAASFLERCRNILDTAPTDSSLKAVVTFLESDASHQKLFADPNWIECAKVPGCNLTFRVAGQNELVCQSDAIRSFVEREVPAPTNPEDSGEVPTPVQGVCLVTGQYARLARTHPRTPLPDKNSKSNAKLVSFQKASGFDSYGRQQSYNAPVGEHAAFNYTTALNHLLRRDSPNRIQVGDASTVFWAAEDSAFAGSFAAMFGATDQDNPDSGVQAVRGMLKATETGAYVPDDRDVRFYVLGLAPNAARIAVRFWKEGPVRDFALHIAQHFKDIEIVAPGFEKPYLPLYRLLNSTALLNKGENVPPNMAGDTMRAILTGLPYPAMLLQAAVRRCRAERQINYPRAAVIKATINRLIRHQQLNAKELDMSLNRNNTDPGYRLGRLFSALERVQSAAQPGINSTIRDRYYGAASSSPSSVFPVLLRLKNHHLAKLDGGLATWYEKLFGEIFSGIEDFPPQLSLKEQGLFAIGYYHQQQDFFAGKSKPTSTPDSNAGEN